MAAEKAVASTPKKKVWVDLECWPDSRFGIVTERKCAGRQCPLTDVEDGVIVEIVSLGSTAAADVDKPENLV